MNDTDQSQNSTNLNLKRLSEKLAELPEERRERIEQLSNIIIKEHSETLKALAESEKKELQFELAMAEDIWLKVKGIPIPDCYSETDRLHIFERYYHRAVSKSQGE